MIEEPGYYRGQHYTCYVEEVKSLKRKGDLDAAEKLLLALVDATETESAARRCGVAPGYYQWLAMIYRKRKEYQKECAILERFSRQKHARGELPPVLLKRLEKARLLLRTSTASFSE